MSFGLWLGGLERQAVPICSLTSHDLLFIVSIDCIGPRDLWTFFYGCSNALPHAFMRPFRETGFTCLFFLLSLPSFSVLLIAYKKGSSYHLKTY